MSDDHSKIREDPRHDHHEIKEGHIDDHLYGTEDQIRHVQLDIAKVELEIKKIRTS